MEWLTLVLLGGALGTDETSVGQTMVSRPLIAGSVTGLVSGSLTYGFLVGVFLECIYVSQLQVGGSRVPDGATAAVVGAVVASAYPTAAGVVVGLVAALIIGDIGGRVIVAFRRWCGRVVPARPGTEVPPGHLGRLHLALVAADFVRGAVVTSAGLLTVSVWVALAASWPLDSASTRGLLAVAAATALGVNWSNTVGGRGRIVLLAAGLFLSLAVGTP